MLFLTAVFSSKVLDKFLVLTQRKYSEAVYKKIASEMDETENEKRKKLNCVKKKESTWFIKA